MEGRLTLYFRSKQDLWLFLIAWIPMIAALIAVIWGYLTTKEGLIGIILFVPFLFGVAWLWFTTGYEITEEHLVIKYGPFRKRIDLQTVTSLRKTRSILSAPALSIDRIEILYDKYGYVFISPVRQQEFLALMKERCPQAKIQ